MKWQSTRRQRRYIFFKNTQNIFGFNLFLYFCFFQQYLTWTCGSLENPKVNNADSLFRLTQVLAEQRRIKRQSFYQTKNAGSSNCQIVLVTPVSNWTYIFLRKIESIKILLLCNQYDKTGIGMEYRSLTESCFKEFLLLFLFLVRWKQLDQSCCLNIWILAWFIDNLYKAKFLLTTFILTGSSTIIKVQCTFYD